MNIILADDHSLIRSALKDLMNKRFQDIHISEVGTCHELMRLLHTKAQFTHLILDINLADGNTLDLLPTVRSLYERLKIMVFSQQSRVILAPAVKRYGIEYIVGKDDPHDILINRLDDFLHDRPFLIHEKTNTDPNPFSRLAPRELEVLLYILKGFSTAEIADTLNLARNTVSTMRTRIHEKTNTNRVSKLIELATAHGLR